MSILPREMVKWIQTLDLSIIVKNPKRYYLFLSSSHIRLLLFIHLYFSSYRDFANGFIIGEIFSRYFPSEINTRSFDSGTSRSAKTQNWEYLNTFFQKKEVPGTPKMMDDTMNCRPDGTQQLLDTIYTFLTRRNAPVRPQIRKSDGLPPYAQPTTSSLIKSHEDDTRKADQSTVTREV